LIDPSGLYFERAWDFGKNLVHETIEVVKTVPAFVDCTGTGGDPTVSLSPLLDKLNDLAVSEARRNQIAAIGAQRGGGSVTAGKTNSPSGAGKKK
jgi:predicted TIM-barrel enzyme